MEAVLTKLQDFTMTVMASVTEPNFISTLWESIFSKAFSINESLV